jgi:hypothetical protein
MLSALAGMSMSPERLEQYPLRCERVVEALAHACALAPAEEVERFKQCRDILGPLSDDKNTDDLMGRVSSMLGDTLPLQFEFVLTFASDAPLRFAFMTHGRSGASLPLTLSRLLRAALRLHVCGNGDPEESLLLAEQFKLAFPSIEALRLYSPMAQGMIVSVVPLPQRTGLKVYFNTRLDTTTPHRERIFKMLERSGLSDHGLYDVLYEQGAGVSFSGVGVDLDGDGHHRMKLYVRVDRTMARGLLQRVAERLDSQAPHEIRQQLLEPVDRLLAVFDAEHVAPTVELAVALRDREPPTIKVTTFLAAKTRNQACVDQLARYLGSLGYAADALRAAVLALEDPHDPATSKRIHPLHGVGLEVPAGAHPKINVYLEPTL